MSAAANRPRIGFLGIGIMGEASKLSGEEIYSALFNFALLRPRYGFRPKKRPHERIPQRETAGTETEGAHLKSR